jgi:hypothetical protein
MRASKDVSDEITIVTGDDDYTKAIEFQQKDPVYKTLDINVADHKVKYSLADEIGGLTEV